MLFCYVMFMVCYVMLCYVMLCYAKVMNSVNIHIGSYDMYLRGRRVKTTAWNQILRNVSAYIEAMMSNAAYTM